MPLESLLLKNYQKHKRLVIEFSPTVTCLVGQSDAGKSSILRALKWLATNRPGGTAFIRRDGERNGENEGRTSVASLSVDGHSLKRIRGKKRNSYLCDGETLAAFGAGVPDAVTQLLNVGSINFQSQHDPAFLFSLSPGQAASALNEVVNLNAIDSVLGNLASGLRKARATAEVAQDRLREATARRDSLAWVVAADARLHQVEARYGLYSYVQNKRARLNDLLQRVQQAGEDADLASYALPALATAIAAGEQLQQVQGRGKRLRTLLEDIQVQGERIQRLTVQADSIGNTLSQQSNCPLCGSAFSHF